MTSPKAQAGGRAWWLVELDLGGRLWRWSTEVLQVPRRDGSMVPYRSGLTGDLRISLRGQSSVSVSVSDGQDWAQLRAMGLPLEAARATVRRWWPGQKLEEARVVLRGSATGVRLGAEGEGIAFSVVPDQAQATASGSFPGPLSRILADSTTTDTSQVAVTWPVTSLYAGAAIGAYYPEVIGYPGSNGDGQIPYDAVPAPFCEWTPASGAGKHILIAGHRVDAGTVRVKDVGDSRPFAGGNYTVIPSQDALGRDVSLVDLQGGAFTPDGTKTYAVGYSTDSSYGGGRLWRGRVLWGAGDVISWAHETYARGAPFDRSRHDAVAQQLNAFKVDTFVNTPVAALEWLQKAVLSWLPVAKVAGADGYYWRTLSYEPERERVRRHLDADLGQIRRVGEPSVEDHELANEVTVDYGRARASERGYKTRTVTAERGKLASDPTWYGLVSDDDRVLPSWHAASSRAQHGVQPLSVQASTFDDSTALLVAQRWILARHVRRPVHRYQGSAADLEDLDVEDRVLVTDGEVYLSEAVCKVQDIVLGATFTEVVLVVLDEPLAGRQRWT